ncbi:AAA family ATPase [Lacticaseibacillus pabuli]|uniref:AAA family ATPase n=1 Tax=Lacticaseibacillus pabuli TaxID=3025672 RepID=A0ABY7WR98_9LACO|nr:AAA family ATPase [Lacticaseibacillus sp. KACC 23028]WDF82309.1 AAA family ATPase [Lacticaseibacillus sp. KACC 23028]
MTTQVILIRGNSGSGKTTLAKQLQQELPDSMLISQDTFRRDILNAPDHPGNKSEDLILANAYWANEHVHYLIIEGILKRSVYTALLGKLRTEFGRQLHSFYYDLSFEETLLRNESRAMPFLDGTLEKWWVAKDALGDEDVIFTDKTTLDEQKRAVLGQLN